MPKPWDPKKSGGLRSGSLIHERTKCVALMGAIVIEWSSAEETLGQYYSELVCGTTVPGIPVQPGAWAAMETFDMVTSLDQRVKMLVVAAERRQFQKNIVNGFEDKLQRIKDAYKKRIIVAHGRWMIDDTVGNALVWQRRLGGFTSEAMVYFEADFEQWRVEIATAANNLSAFFAASIRPRLEEHVRALARHTKTAIEDLNNTP